MMRTFIWNEGLPPKLAISLWAHDKRVTIALGAPARERLMAEFKASVEECHRRIVSVQQRWDALSIHPWKYTALGRLTKHRLSVARQQWSVCRVRQDSFIQQYHTIWHLLMVSQQMVHMNERKLEALVSESRQQAAISTS